MLTELKVKLLAFVSGTILAVIFDSMPDLVAVWQLHEGKQLSALFQSVVVDRALLKALGVRKLTLRVRVWPDELEACREEMRKMATEAKRVSINSRRAYL